SALAGKAFEEVVAQLGRRERSDDIGGRKHDTNFSRTVETQELVEIVIALSVRLEPVEDRVDVADGGAGEPVTLVVILATNPGVQTEQGVPDHAGQLVLPDV